MLHLTVAENFFKKNPLVCHMLVDNPQAVVPCGQNKRLTKLFERLERAEMVEVCGGLFGLDNGGGRGCSRALGNSRTMRAAVFLPLRPAGRVPRRPRPASLVEAVREALGAMPKRIAGNGG